MELHFVHFKRQYENFSRAMSMEGGLSVLSVLFKVRESGSILLLTPKTIEYTHQLFVV